MIRGMSAERRTKNFFALAVAIAVSGSFASLFVALETDSPDGTRPALEQQYVQLETPPDCISDPHISASTLQCWLAPELVQGLATLDRTGGTEAP